MTICKHDRLTMCNASSKPDEHPFINTVIVAFVFTELTSLEHWDFVVTPVNPSARTASCCESAISHTTTKYSAVHAVQYGAVLYCAVQAPNRGTVLNLLLWSPFRINATYSTTEHCSAALNMVQQSEI